MPCTIARSYRHLDRHYFACLEQSDDRFGLLVKSLRADIRLHRYGLRDRPQRSLIA